MKRPDYLTPTTPEDRAELLANLRDLDRQEIMIQGYPDIPAALEDYATKSKCFSIRIGGDICGIVGILDARNLFAKESRWWLVSTNAITRHRIEFIRRTRDVLGYLFSISKPQIKRAGNVVWEGHKPCIRWLKSAGAVFSDRHVVFHEGKRHEFTKWTLERSIYGT